jgi:antitoxin HigA-1
MWTWKTITEETAMTKPPKRGLPPMHPGELLREEILPALGRPKTEIARLLGVSRQTLYDILEERQPVTPGMALRLGKLCGNGPDLWLNLQKRYDLDQAERALRAVLARIPILETAA